MAADNGIALAASLWTISVVSGAVLGLRLVAKLIRGRHLWWDDHIMIFSWLVLFVATILMQRAVALGFGRNSSTLSYDNQYQISTYSVIYSASLTVVVATARISFGCALLRATSGWGKVTVWVVITGLICITMIPLVITRFTICVPFQKVYGVDADGYCGNTYIPLYIGWASGAWSATSDFALTILAWKIVLSMTMKQKEKIGVGIALSFGLLSGCLTVFRYVYVGLIYAQDFFQYGYLGFIWVAAEGATSIIAASIPALRAFVADKSHSRHSACSNRRWPLPLSYMNRASDGRSSSAGRSLNPPRTPHSPPPSSRQASHDNEYHMYHRYETDQDIIFSDEWDDELGSARQLPLLARQPGAPPSTTTTMTPTTPSSRKTNFEDPSWGQFALTHPRPRGWDE